MLSVPKLFRSVAHHSHRLSSSIAASTRLFSFTATQKSEKNFAEVEDILKEADASQTAVPERQKPRQSEGITRGNTFDLHNVRVLQQGALRARPSDFTRPPQTGPARRKRALLGPPAAESRRHDIFYQLGLDPLHECQNSTLLSRYVTEMGKIRSRAETGLTWKNQRRLGKAIRRAKMMGIMPVLSRRSLGVGFTARAYH